MKKIILIAGDRYWTDLNCIKKAIETFDSKETLIVHGACQGADQIGAKVANHLNFKVQSFPADWKKYGHAAGPIRNKQMVDYMLNMKKLDKELDLQVFAFHNSIETSKGTKHCIQYAKSKNIKVTVFKSI